MAFQDMVVELRGQLPKLPISFAPTLINRAWREIRENFYWSFNIYEQSWITPPIISSGTVTVTQGFNQIVFDNLVAVPAILANALANPYSLITQRQFRIGVGGIYNIVGLDPAFNTNGLAYLDRIWGDPGGTFNQYTIYQLYYTPQFQDHLKWLSVRNPVMFLNLDVTTTRKQIDGRDPQRLWYAWPTNVVSWGRDLRGVGQVDNFGRSLQSGTVNFPMYELWGQPVNPFTYQCYGLRNGVPLVNPDDTIPPSVGEDLVIAKAKWYAYEWAEANKDIAPRNSDPDFKFLMGKANDDYKKLLVLYRRQDRDLTDNYFLIRGMDVPIFSLGHYNTLSSTSGPA
jgi:hypothetical protein